MWGQPGHNIMLAMPRRITWVALLSLFALITARCNANPQTVEVTRVVIETTTAQGEPAVVTRIVHEQREVVATPIPSPQPESEIFIAPDPSRLVITLPGDPITLDPALAYDLLSLTTLRQMLEGLIIFDHLNPTRFVPVLATEVPSEENGLISADGTTFTFPIREGVLFHDGSRLEPHDVAYSIRRGLLLSDPSSPQWLFIEAIMDYAGGDITERIGGGAFAYDPAALVANAAPEELLATCAAVMEAVSFDDEAGTVVIRLARPYSSFLSIIASLLSITDQEWAIANGAWDGDCATWQNYYAPGIEGSSLSRIANGTGPYRLDHWTPGTELVMDAHRDYWRVDGTPLFPGGPAGVASIPRVILGTTTGIEWSTALLQMIRGDSDLVVYLPEDQIVVKKEIGEFCDYKTGVCTPNPDNPDGPLRKWDDLPDFSRVDLLMNFDISPDSPYIGSGKLDGEGVPPDFFNDVNVRKAMATCFDYDTYLNDVLLEGGIRNNGPIIVGMLGYNEDGPLYEHDPEACAAYLAEAWGGVLPETGFQFSLVHDSTNPSINAIGAILQEQLAAINEKYRLEISVIASPLYNSALLAGQAPMFLAGWLEDYHDPHNWAHPYTVGVFAAMQNMPDELRGRFREYVDAGIATADPAAREQAYFALQQHYYDNAPGIILGQASTYYIEPRYMGGWYFNEAYTITPVYAQSFRSR